MYYVCRLAQADILQTHSAGSKPQPGRPPSADTPCTDGCSYTVGCSKLLCGSHLAALGVQHASPWLNTATVSNDGRVECWQPSLTRRHLRPGLLIYTALMYHAPKLEACNAGGGAKPARKESPSPILPPTPQMEWPLLRAIPSS